MITKFKIFEGIKWYNKGKWEDEGFSDDVEPVNEYGKKVVITKIRSNDIYSNKGYVFCMTDAYGYTILNTDNFISGWHIPMVHVNAEEADLIRNDKIWITNGINTKSRIFKKWKYSELVSVFGKKNIIL